MVGAMKLLLSPHDDDQVLWCAWTILREEPTVCIVYDSFVQTARGVEGCDAQSRKIESIKAQHELFPPDPVYPHAFRGKSDLFDLGLRDDTDYAPAYIRSEIQRQTNMTYTEVWAPAYEEGGHDQHNVVARVGDLFEAEGCVVHRYLTYTRGGGKSRNEPYRDGRIGRPGVEVLPRSAEDIQKKLRALACFKSQMQLDPRIGCAEWFYGTDLREYALLTPSKGGPKQ
jgi:hypothetical protein